MEAGKAPGGYDVLSLRTGPELLRALETEEWGRPLALSDVIVSRHVRYLILLMRRLTLSLQERCYLLRPDGAPKQFHPFLQKFIPADLDNESSMVVFLGI